MSAPRFRLIDPIVYDKAEAARIEAANRWRDTPEEQAARRAVLDGASAWWTWLLRGDAA